ncbi:MAG: type II toxin-antitoxin system CcdA family antitoxin [Pedobacter sp.]|jgi:antitoxin CcdA
MQLHYDTKAPRQSVNLTANSDLLRLSRSKKVNLSALLEKSMIEFLKQNELVQWREENRESFDSYNRMIETDGMLSEESGLL